jgi:hypothetical protein
MTNFDDDFEGIPKKLGTLNKPAIAEPGAKCSYPVGGPYCRQPALWLVQGYAYCDEHLPKAHFDSEQYAEARRKVRG